MMDQVHIDEKWFYITEQTACFLLAPDKEPPHRTAKSKWFITKVMFMCALAAPHQATTSSRISYLTANLVCGRLSIKNQLNAVVKIVNVVQW